MVTKQLRASGGIWLKWEGLGVLIDPGPGTLVKCAKSRPKLDPTKLEAIVLTHRHLDHSADINVMIEAMTEGGFKKKGLVFVPQDALEQDPVILKYVRRFVKEIEILKEGREYRIGNLSFNTPIRHIHGTETYGLNFFSEARSTSGKRSKKKEIILSIVTDTKYFEGLERNYPGRVLVLNVVRYEPREGLDHLCVADAERIIENLKPQSAILTHFGMTMLRAGPYQVAAKLGEKLGMRVIAARDGMEFNLEE